MPLQDANPTSSFGGFGLSYAVGKVSSDGSIDPLQEHLGGLVGSNAGTINSGLWDTASSGQGVGIGIEIGDGLSSGIFGKTTAELQSPAGYTGPYQGWDVLWSFEGTEFSPDYSLNDFWDFGTRSEYPALKVDLDGDGTATWQEFGIQRGDAPEPTPAPMVDNCVEVMTTPAISGAWTGDCASSSQPGSYGRFYTFTLDEPANVSISLESETTDTYLSLLQGQGRTGMELESHSSLRRNSRLNHRLGAGIYTVEATTNLARHTGSFTLTISGLPTPPPSPTPAHTVTATPSPTPTVGPTSTPALVPTPPPTAVPAPPPTAVPAPPPTAVPTTAPTVVPITTPTLVPITTPTAVPTPPPTAVPAPPPTAVPTTTPTLVPTSTTAPVEPTGVPEPTEIAEQEPTPDPESGGACSFRDEDTPPGAAAISMFLLVAPLAMIGGLKFRARRRQTGNGAGD